VEDKSFGAAEQKFRHIYFISIFFNCNPRNSTAR